MPSAMRRLTSARGAKPSTGMPTLIDFETSLAYGRTEENPWENILVTWATLMPTSLSSLLRISRTLSAGIFNFSKNQENWRRQ